MLVKAFWKHKRALTSELPFSAGKRFVRCTSFLQGGGIYLSALSDATVMSVIEDLGDTNVLCTHSFQKVGRYHLYMNIQNSDVSG